MKAPFRADSPGAQQRAHGHGQRADASAQGGGSAGHSAAHGARSPDRLAHGPPSAEEGAGARPLLGTILSLQADSVLDELWDDILHVTPIETVGVKPQGKLAAVHELAAHARNLEIFLDYLVSEIESKRCRVLLNPKFTSLLSPNSRALRLCLERFLAELPEEAKRSGAFQQLLATLLIMGLRTEALRALVADPTLEGPYHRRMSKLALTLPNNVRAYRHVLAQHRGKGRQ